ncbi:MAG TPA: site-2 protease family protein [Terriglobales bacterium]|nr:site-2 protease family protein [Terriglobales bacterium]
MRIRVSPLFVLLLAAFLYVDGTGFALLLLLAAALHEAGHLIALKGCGVGIEEVSFRAFGIEMTTGDTRYIPYRGELAIAVAGPAVNLFAMLVTLGAVAAVGPFWGALFFVFCNAALAVVNLMPVSGLDGGRILAAVLMPWLGPPRAERILAVVSAVFSALVAGAGLWLLWVTKYNFSLAMIGAYLIARRAFGPAPLLQKCSL